MTDKNAAKGDGYFYRRYKQKHLPIESDIPGTIYYCIGTPPERISICCHTKDLKIAEQLIQKHFTDIDLTDPQKFLKSLARAGEQARKKLDHQIT